MKKRILISGAVVVIAAVLIIFISSITRQPRVRITEEERAQVTSRFDTMIGSFIDGVSVYKQLDPSFLPTKESLADVPFETKQEPQDYLAKLKLEFRTAISTYNTAHPESKLALELDIPATISQMTTQEKVGQMLGFAIRGKSLDAESETKIKELGIGAIAFFGNNVESKEQVTAFAKQLQATSENMPMLIAADQEGGPVSRFSWVDYMSPMDIAALPADKQCEIWHTRSQQLAEMGINWNLGIIADVSQDTKSFIYTRIFSPDYNTAASSVAIAANCSGDVISTLKHFPGHGGTSVDTHKGLGVLNSTTKAEWLSKDAIPFFSGNQ